MKEGFFYFFADLANDLTDVDTGIVLLAVIIVASVIVLDAVTLSIRKKRRTVGLEKRGTTVSLDGGKSIPVRHYVSDMQGIAGKPDALIIENGFIIPVERKPLAKKIRDRYVAQILVYMRLVEEFEGKKPPYGYLILGPNCRKFKIDNTPQRQEWLQKMLDEMHEILDGQTSKPSPHPKKCSKCDVREHCSYAVINTPNTNQGLLAKRA